MHSDEIIAALIPQRRSGGRYRMDDVDDFLDACALALRDREQGRTPTLTSTEILTRQFPTVGLFGLGYDADAVDRLLDEIAGGFRAYEPASVQAAQEAEVRAMLDQVRKLGERKD